MAGWHVVNNITGLRVSKTFDTEEDARSICGAMNTDAGPGSLYGVIAEASTTAWAVIQEGGTSIELYLSVWNTLEEAEGFRRDCAAGGAYRTTEPVELPDDTDWNAVENLLQSVATLDLAEYDEDDYDEDGEFITQEPGEGHVEDSLDEDAGGMVTFQPGEVTLDNEKGEFTRHEI